MLNRSRKDPIVRDFLDPIPYVLWFSLKEGLGSSNSCGTCSKKPLGESKMG